MPPKRATKSSTASMSNGSAIRNIELAQSRARSILLNKINERATLRQMSHKDIAKLKSSAGPSFKLGHKPPEPKYNLPKEWHGIPNYRQNYINSINQQVNIQNKYDNKITQSQSKRGYTLGPRNYYNHLTSPPKFYNTNEHYEYNGADASLSDDNNNDDNMFDELVRELQHNAQIREISQQRCKSLQEFQTHNPFPDSQETIQPSSKFKNNYDEEYDEEYDTKRQMNKFKEMEDAYLEEQIKKIQEMEESNKSKKLDDKLYDDLDDELDDELEEQLKRIRDMEESDRYNTYKELEKQLDEYIKEYNKLLNKLIEYKNQLDIELSIPQKIDFKDFKDFKDFTDEIEEFRMLIIDNKISYYISEINKIKSIINELKSIFPEIIK